MTTTDTEAPADLRAAIRTALLSVNHPHDPDELARIPDTQSVAGRVGDLTDAVMAAIESHIPAGLYENWAVGYTDTFGDRHHVQCGSEDSARSRLVQHPRGSVLERRWQTDWATVYPQRDTGAAA